MPAYKCNICAYSTSERFNFARHLSTKKHAEKEMSYNKNQNPSFSVSHKFANSLPPLDVKKYVCLYCGFETVHGSSFSKHERRCINKQKHDNELLSRLKTAENQAQMFKEKSENLERFYKDQIESFKEIVLEAKNSKSSVPALLYEHCEDNPHITRIEIAEFDNLIKPKIKLIKEIVSRFRHKTLHKFLGDFIVSVYKKDDIQSQSVFSTDSARMNYMIKELLFDKTSNWILDKRGVKTSEYLISPVIEHTKKLIEEYSDSLTNNTNNLTSRELEHIIYAKRELIDLINDIDDGRLADRVNRYISPLLKMERIKMKKLENKKKLPVLDN